MIKVNVYTDTSGEDAGYVVEGEDRLYPFPADPRYPHTTTALDVLKGEFLSVPLKAAEEYYYSVGYILFDDNLNVVEEVYETIH